MRHFSFFIFTLLLFSIPTYAQLCYPDGVLLSTQQEIDNFKANNPGCKQIGGSLRITGNNITNLLGLNELTSVDFSIRVEHNPNLTSLAGLENIKQAAILSIYDNALITSLQGLNGLETLLFTAGIFDNPQLTSLQGLGKLKDVPSTLSFSNNPKLPNLNGLDALTHIGGLTLDNNDMLASLSGMPLLNSFDGLIDIQDNNILANLQGLESVDTVTGGLVLLRNAKLNSLSGLGSLVYVEGDLELNRNAELTSLNGLNNLKTITENLLIINNALLTDITALDQLTNVGETVNINANKVLTNLNGLDNIDIQNNPSLTFEIFSNIVLSDCSIDPFCHFPNLHSQFNFHDNITGCNSNTEVYNACLVAVNDPNEKNDITIFPNPTNGLIDFNGMEIDPSNVIITNSQGRAIRDYSVYKNSIDLSSVSNGVYFIILQTENQYIVRRIVKGL